MVSQTMQILKDIRDTTYLKDALLKVVRQTSLFLEADRCSVFINDLKIDRLVLMATTGVLKKEVAEVQTCCKKGLVGWVVEHGEILSLKMASEHPNFEPVSQLEDRSFQAFLGGPIRHKGKTLGVLVVQNRHARKFSENDVAFFSTLIFQLGDALSHLFAKWVLERSVNETRDVGLVVHGVPCAPGLVMGRMILSEPLDLKTIPDRAAQDIKQEIQLFEASLYATKRELKTSKELMSRNLGEKALALFDAYILILESKTLYNTTVAHIKKGQWAQGGFRDAILAMAHKFEELDNPYLAARAEDIRNIGRQVLTNLQNAEIDHKTYPEQCILAGFEISPSEISKVPSENLVGVISVKGSELSHAAIICRELGVPAVFGLTELAIESFEFCNMSIDGKKGSICINPSTKQVQAYHQLIKEELALATQLETLHQLPAQTLDGLIIPLWVNLGGGSNEISSKAEHYDGVGLYRTEFFFIAGETLPTEEQQYRKYRNLLQFFSPKPVIIRTLDTGGDKKLPLFPVEETNPFLGKRGIRFTLDHSEIFLVQLKALLRANFEFGNLQVLFPMISRVNEIDQALDLMDFALKELQLEKKPAEKPLVGAMIEVPSAAYIIEELSRRVDFFSIGTNDLTQFLLAVDRNNPYTQGVNNCLHPAVVQVVSEIIQKAHAQKKPVGVCGEMAGDPGSALLLLGLGVDSLSMCPTRLAPVKSAIRNTSMKNVKRLAKKVLENQNENEIVRLLQQEVILPE